MIIKDSRADSEMFLSNQKSEIKSSFAIFPSCTHNAKSQLLWKLKISIKTKHQFKTDQITTFFWKKRNSVENVQKNRIPNVCQSTTTNVNQTLEGCGFCKWRYFFFSVNWSKHIDQRCTDTQYGRALQRKNFKDFWLLDWLRILVGTEVQH